MLILNVKRIEKLMLDGGFVSGAVKIGDGVVLRRANQALLLIVLVTRVRVRVWVEAVVTWIWSGSDTAVGCNA